MKNFKPFVEEPPACTMCASESNMKLVPSIIDGIHRESWRCNDCGHMHLKALFGQAKTVIELQINAMHYSCHARVWYRDLFATNRGSVLNKHTILLKQKAVCIMYEQVRKALGYE